MRRCSHVRRVLRNEKTHFYEDVFVKNVCEKCNDAEKQAGKALFSHVGLIWEALVSVKGKEQ